MRPAELVVVNLVAAAPESLSEPAAAHVDGQHGVVQAVSQENTGGAVARTRCHKAGRKREEVGKEVTIGEAHGQRVGSAVGETAEGEARWIHGGSRPSVPVNPFRQQTRHFCELVHRMMVRLCSLFVRQVEVALVSCESVVVQYH